MHFFIGKMLEVAKNGVKKFSVKIRRKIKETSARNLFSLILAVWANSTISGDKQFSIFFFLHHPKSPLFVYWLDSCMMALAQTLENPFSFHRFLKRSVLMTSWDPGSTPIQFLEGTLHEDLCHGKGLREFRYK